MKTYKRKNICTLAAMIMLAAVCFTADLHAVSASRYAASSAMADGKWVKVRVTGSGMQSVSNAQLTAMGFSDPSKVNVYGYGGRMISEKLDSSHPDDLPLLPCVRTANGLLFFGVDHIKWEPALTYTMFSHTMQPYAEESFYFLSDRPVEATEIETINLKNIDGLELADSFIERQVHEQDIFAPSVSGRNLLGEDLRSGTTQLTFPTPGNIGGDATINMQIGSNISTSQGTLKLSSANSRLNQTSASIDPVRSSEQFMRTNMVRTTAEGVGESLQLGLSFSTSGVINLIRLDYVEVEYERALKMGPDQLYFYFRENQPVGAILSGITSETQIWEVTEGHSPRKIEFTTVGSEARFRVDNGYHEYIAFNPSKVTRAVENAGTVANQNLHSLETPDMLIISPQEYMAAAMKVAEMHRRNDSMTVHVLTPEEIYNEFSSGTPDVSAFRKLLKMWYDRDMAFGNQKIKYCLIMSRPTYDNKMATQTVKNAGYPRVPIWQSPTGFTDNTSYSTDDFIGMLEDYDNKTMGQMRIQVAVGRFPVRSLEEAMTTVDKLLAYTDDPGRASWRNNVLMLADDQDQGQHLDQTEKMYASLVNSNKGAHYQYERLYLDNFQRQLTSVGLEYPEAKNRLFAKLEEGQALMTYIGHANTVSWTHEHLLNWKDINSFSNTKLPVLYAATCEFARWDADEFSGAEVLWSAPRTGFIAMICPSRSVFINMNGPLSAQFGKFALARNEDGTPTRLGDVYRNTKNAISGSDDNKLRYALMGDPAMAMPVYSYNVDTKEIYGADITNPEVEMPTIEARSNPVIKGVITDSEGAVATDFNGHLFIKLYDAEKVIETLGNGDEGKVMIYNDRKTKLYDGVAKVENGKWEAIIYMPAEIENNFTPGRITYYALADDGREANGATERFFVYGYDQNAADDNEGPDIHHFYLNHKNFQNGDVTYKTPVVYAGFSDESGINISDAGIGHSLMLTLDGKTVYSDIMNFYTPDLTDSRGGSFTYQLPEIPAGKHELTLTVWDCANNSSYATLSFNVAAVKNPDIYDISTEFNADRSGIEFIISSDRPMAALACELEVFDINGVRVWHSNTDDRTDAESALRMKWDYTTAAGNKVGKGIYICRATVETPEGKSARKSKKIVITQ